jgi:FkbM family methyltransferase
LETIRLVDVGARDGIDPRWAPYYAALDVIAFEPDEVECTRLNAASWPYVVTHLPVALGAENGIEATLHVCRSPGCSSLLHPNRALRGQFAYAANMDVVKEVPVTLSRMDSVVRWQPDVMKLDTQGTELDILRGAGELLKETLAVELEVEFIPQYEGQALFADVDVFMRSQGFQLRGLRRTYWRNAAEFTHPFGGQLIHGDALYFRPDKMDCPKGHTIAAAYKQFDMLARFGVHQLIPKRPALVRAVSRLLAGYPNRELRRFADGLRSANADDWHDPDFF